MKRIASIVVIVACVVSLALVWKVGDIKKKQKAEIAQLTDTLNETNAKLDKTRMELAATKTERDQLQAKLADTDAKLTVANATIEEKTKTVAGLQTKVAELDKRVSDATAKLTEAEGTLRKIKDALGIGDIVNVDEIRSRATAQADENKMLGEQLAKMRKANVELQALAHTPEGLKARVAAVENKWGFLVLNVGALDKVHREAQFLVYRDSQLIGKVQVTSVGPNTCIAQMLPEYRRGTPRVGDLAVR